MHRAMAVLAPLTIRDDLMVHAVKSRSDFTEAFAQREAKLMETIVIEALCGVMGRVGTPYRESITCLECLALL